MKTIHKHYHQLIAEFVLLASTCFSCELQPLLKHVQSAIKVVKYKW